MKNPMEFFSPKNANKITLKCNCTVFRSVCLSLIALSMMSFEWTEQPVTPNNVAITMTCPVAEFESNNNVCAGTCVVIFDNLSEKAISYHWDFGDGNTSTAESPQHVYPNEGTYEVTLRAINGTCEDTFIGTIDIIDS